MRFGSVLFFFCTFSTMLPSLELICPYGCGGINDPDVEAVGSQILNSLKKMKFLEVVTEGSESINYEQTWDGQDWELTWEAQADFFFDGDEEESFEEEWHYHFSRQKIGSENGQEIEKCFETDLGHYLETQLLMQHICGDIHFLFDKSQKEMMYNLHQYQQKIQAKQQKDTQYYSDCIRREQGSLARNSQEYTQCLQLFQNMQGCVDSTYHQIFDDCIRRHQWSGSMYCRGLLDFQQGNFISAFDDISKYININEKRGKEEILSDEAYYFKGLLASEVGSYNDAIVHLSRAIVKNPKHKEAYFERAVAYFELGKFDLALKDYLEKGKEAVSQLPLEDPNFYDFGVGMIIGAANGVNEASIEFLPSICASARGVGNLLWTTISHPIATPKQFATAVVEFCNFLRTSDKGELAQILVPEMYNLVVNWDTLSYKDRGELAGYTMGNME